MPNPTSATGNRLLDTLPPHELRGLLPHLESVALRHGELLQAENAPIESVHFLTAGLASVVAPMEDGALVELALIGNDGVTSSHLVFGSGSTPHRCFVQAAGSALRMTAGTFADEMRERRGLRDHVLRFAQSVSVQTAQTAACNAVHTLEERLARWLLSARDRLGSNELPLTHEFLSMMLAVRRSGVTVAAGLLQQAGIVRYHRGHITVLDGEALEDAACECYRIVRDETARLLP